MRASYLTCVWWSLCVLGCGSPAPSTTDGAVSCSSDEDCQPGYVCREGECVEKPPCTDLDQDSYCDVRETCALCTDCNDNRPDIHPGAPEQCGDGMDDDCDGETDEDCPCEAGESRPCGTDVGSCERGRQSCVDGDWGPCEDSVEPAPDEDCADLLDNDCDGSINEGCPCQQGDSRSCGFGQGECTPGVQTCLEEGGEWIWSVCQGGTPPVEEICEDGLDNDCDGSIDNGCACDQDRRPCGLNIGICHAGIQNCYGGLWGPCEGARTPEDEVCDGLDNDCDRIIDEGCDCLDGTMQVCGDDTGECRLGTRTCLNGQWGECEQSQGPLAELCDGKDNDCDTLTDEDFPDLRLPCEAGLGICVRPGILICTVDGTATNCNAVPGQGMAELCDGLDNDCDGATDEDFAGLGEACSIGQGACFSTGVTVCGQTGGIACSAPVIAPVNELCDDLDNDCDGLTDENFPLFGLPCTAGIGECFSTGIFVCSLDGSSTECDATPLPGGSEDCDGLDNDCDGMTDEDWMQTCSTACGDGFQFCVAGTPGPCSARQPDPDDSYCDDFDGDCDGLTDEDVVNLGANCQSGTGGCQSLGFFVCSDNGGIECNAVAGTPRSEGLSYSDTCFDGVDNDCNGLTDCQQSNCMQSENTSDTCGDEWDNDCDGLTDMDDDDCNCRNLSMQHMVPLHVTGGALGIVILRRRRKRDREDESGGAS